MPEVPEHIRNYLSALAMTENPDFPISNDLIKENINDARQKILQDPESLYYLFFCSEGKISASEFFSAVKDYLNDIEDSFFKDDLLKYLRSDDFANIIYLPHYSEQNIPMEDKIAIALKVLINFGDLRTLAKVFTHPLVIDAYTNNLPCSADIVKHVPYDSLPLKIQALILATMASEQPSLYKGMCEQLQIRDGGIDLRRCVYGYEPPKVMPCNPL